MSEIIPITKPTRKFPPPCWTRDEALILIEAYGDRWYALHHAFLRNPDWDLVAEKVTTSCADVTPPKTSAQCRHKMEKLRQRHRAEKQRAAAFPGGKFSSNWFYFEAMEAMENGDVKNPDLDTGSGQGHPGLNPGRGIRFKPSGVAANMVTLAANPNSYWDNQEDGSYVDNVTINPYKNHGLNNMGNLPYAGRIRVKPVVPFVAPRKVRKVVNDVDEDGEMWVKMPRNGTVYEGDRDSNVDLKQGKKRGSDGVSGISEVVMSIKMLGEGFMKMEKMKIDMAREIERMRVESEMKRNQLILELQKQTVDAFLKGVSETRKQPRREGVTDL